MSDKTQNEPSRESKEAAVVSSSSKAVAADPRSGLEKVIEGFRAMATLENFAFTFVMALACAITLPYLGSSGFFDPWETHYAEVARRMVEDDNYLYPSWRTGHFFSKPILLFWMSSVGYTLNGAGTTEGVLPVTTELMGRLPGALFAIFTVAAVYITARRLWSMRAALFAGIVLSTMPFWGFLSRQAITDMLYVGPMSIAICLLAIAFFDDKNHQRFKEAKIPYWLLGIFALGTLPQFWEIGRKAHFLNGVSSEVAARLALGGGLCALTLVGLFLLRRFARDPLVHAAAFLVALGTLGKGPHALLLTGMVYFLYLVCTWEWRHLKRASLISGIALYLVVSMPWYLVMAIYPGRNMNNKTWVGRFIMSDLLGRIGVGVHGDRGTSSYYVSYLSYGLYPWVTLWPIATLRAAFQKLPSVKERTASQRFTFLVMLWGVSFFVFFTATTTKFHHYIFPVTVPAALMIGWWLDRVLREKQPLSMGVTAICALGTFIIGRDLITEPWQLVDLFTYHYKSWKPKYYFPTDVDWHVWMSVAVTLTVALVVVGAALNILQERVPEKVSRFTKPFDALMNVKRGGAFVTCVLLAGIVFQMFAVHVYLNKISQHWTQRWLFNTYYEMREPGEPIIAYQMDWKGETFYGHNDEIQIKKSASELKKTCEKMPGREFVVVQSDRYTSVKNAVGKKFKVSIVDRSSKKWVLVLIE